MRLANVITAKRQFDEDCNEERYPTTKNIHYKENTLENDATYLYILKTRLWKFGGVSLCSTMHPSI